MFAMITKWPMPQGFLTSVTQQSFPATPPALVQLHAGT